MKLGYNTNGLAFHRPPDALELLAETGYRSVAITVDHDLLDPFGPELDHELEQMRKLLERLELSSVIETGARFLLNSRAKHEPTLMSSDPEGRKLRIDFLKRSIAIAAELGSKAVSFWSGTLHETISEQAAFGRLARGLEDVCDFARAKDVRLAFEPEPGMFIQTMGGFATLLQHIDAPQLGLTIDIGHLHCVDRLPITEHLREWAPRLLNVHIEDMRRGVHEHLRFGEGEIDFGPVLATLQEIGYTGGVHVELSRHSHMAPQVVRESFEFLSNMLERIDVG